MKRTSITFKILLFAFATLCVVSFVALSFAQITEIGHECYMDSCPVCTAAAVRDNILDAWAYIALMLFCFVIAIFAFCIGSIDQNAKEAVQTPVRLKVKLSN